MIVPLSQAYPSIYGVPVIRQVDTAIFTYKYFAYCMQCTFCRDACCHHGVDVDTENLKRIRARLKDLEIHLGVPEQHWFHDELEACAECPGEALARTKNHGNRCVFLNPTGRGCRLHAFCIEQSLDYHALKPMVCCLFPITFNEDLLCPADDVVDHTLICQDQGVPLYRGVRDELAYYWGAELVAELDRLSEKIVSAV